MTVDNRDRLIAELADSEIQLTHQLAVNRRTSLATILAVWPGISGQASQYSEGGLA